jgi:hypothetical protein
VATARAMSLVKMYEAEAKRRGLDVTDAPMVHAGMQATLVALGGFAESPRYGVRVTISSDEKLATACVDDFERLIDADPEGILS